MKSQEFHIIIFFPFGNELSIFYVYVCLFVSLPLSLSVYLSVCLYVCVKGISLRKQNIKMVLKFFESTKWLIFSIRVFYLPKGLSQFNSEYWVFENVNCSSSIIYFSVWPYVILMRLFTYREHIIVNQK